MNAIAEETGIEVHVINSGYTGNFNIGSPSISVMKRPSSSVVGTGLNSLEAGEVWHLLDKDGNVDYLVPIEQLSSADLNRYNVLVMPNGSYGAIASPNLKN